MAGTDLFVTGIALCTVFVSFVHCRSSDILFTIGFFQFIVNFHFNDYTSVCFQYVLLTKLGDIMLHENTPTSII